MKNFLPAAGWYNCYSGGSVNYASEGGSYWSSQESGSDFAYALSFGSDYRNVSTGNRAGGYSVRPVLVEGNTEDYVDGSWSW